MWERLVDGTTTVAVLALYVAVLINAVRNYGWSPPNQWRHTVRAKKN